MVSLLDRLFPLRPEVKAETGSGLFALQGFDQLSSYSAQQNKLMAEAEGLFRSNVWVAAAERAITSRLAGVAYHLEDAATDEPITSDTSPVAASLIRLLDHPSPRRTRRQLWGITGRHMGLAGSGFWYLDQLDFLAGTPLACLYVNPIRMTPAEDDGGNLLGWIMDHPLNPLTPRGRKAVPFELKEIIHFPLDEPDSGHWGIGVAESAHAKTELSRLTDRHAGLIVASGGRLAGIISPKQGGQTISEDGWQAIVRDYRNITGDPDSAKRLQVMKSPVDFTPTAMNATEMQLPQLATMARDDVLAAWGVPLSQLGIVPARGLNSGETPKFEEAQLWQGAIQARLDVIREKIQTELVDRFAELGLNATIEFESPSFDDLAPLFDNAVKATSVPLTNDERRALVSLDPLEDKELGAQVYVVTTMGRIDEVPEPTVPSVPARGTGGVAVGMPMDSGGPATESGDTQQLAQGEGIKGKAGTIGGLRRQTELRWEPRIRRTVRDVLVKQRQDVANLAIAKHGHLVAHPKDISAIWDSVRETKRLTDALEPLILAMGKEVTVEAAKRFPPKVKAVALDAGWQTGVLDFLQTRTGERITKISEARREEIAKLVETAVDEGLSPLELASLINEDGLFGEYAAERIARTELMFAYNDAALGTYRELGSEYVEAIDGDDDEACSARLLYNPWPIEDAFAEQDHPNGTLDWVPIVSQAEILDALDEGKAQDTRPPAAIWAGIEALAKAAAIPTPEPLAPIINVAAPPIPAVTIDNREVAEAIRELKALLVPKPRKVTVLRDTQGRITGTMEE